MPTPEEFAGFASSVYNFLSPYTRRSDIQAWSRSPRVMAEALAGEHSKALQDAWCTFERAHGGSFVNLPHRWAFDQEMAWLRRFYKCQRKHDIPRVSLRLNDKDAAQRDFLRARGATDIEVYRSGLGFRIQLAKEQCRE